MLPNCMSATKVKKFNIKLVGIGEEFAVIVQNKEKQFTGNQYDTTFYSESRIVFFKRKFKDVQCSKA